MAFGSGLVSAITAEDQDLPTPDLAALYQTISQAGSNQRDLINGLPKNIQDQLAKYQASLATAGTTYQNNVAAQGNNYLGLMKGIYGPNSDAANAEKLADKTSIYSTVPGTQDAIRSALAATGGLSRGHAGTALAQPYLQAAQQNGQAAMNVDAKQTAQGQSATQTALSTINGMNDTMIQNLFGMSKAQASTILTAGTQALQAQLAQLINQSVNESNQKLNLEGITANVGYQNDVTRNAQSLNTMNQMWDTGMSLIQPSYLSAIQSGMGAMGSSGGGAGGGMDASAGMSA